ncbi:MAG: GNAT family N-acetyltransferase [Gammaproteobacteria bacterium]
MPDRLSQAQIITPKAAQLSDCFMLRWRLLRKPWNQAIGSEQDAFDTTAMHCAILLDQTIIATGRCHFESANNACIRYMAVAEEHQQQGLGSLLLQALETMAVNQSANRITLQARDSCVEFYRRHGYAIIRESHKLFDSIQHYEMHKEITHHG